MKIVVIGGTGLIGSRVVERLKSQGHEAVAAAPKTGVNEVLKGASAVVARCGFACHTRTKATDYVLTEYGKRESMQTKRKTMMVTGAARGIGAGVTTAPIRRLGFVKAKCQPPSAGFPADQIASSDCIAVIPGFKKRAAVVGIGHGCAASWRPAVVNGRRRIPGPLISTADAAARNYRQPFCGSPATASVYKVRT